MSREALPSTRVLLTRIFNHLSTFPPSPTTSATTTSTEPHVHGHEPQHPLLPPTAKPLLLTLHSLLPHCLLPALDLLDRGLVERWIPQGLDPTSTNPSTAWVYYITSKPTLPEPINPFRSGTSSSTPGIYTYEVRPSIWHCTCANFTLYAFASAAEPATVQNNVEQQVDGKTAWVWGSPYLSPSHPSAIPVCKHLLAAVLAEQCPALFGTFVRTKQDVPKEEMAEKACWWD